ncbi:hypothetical protein GH714_001092 [Hevea brasiliensis]|uniref:BHLH domain-containing protein n=1 Tax=Hevea brasiliensis TaxID=3981 RepID=A0A6A6LWX3_HEVBR|nr:hypothetical protein GH714_001092 [Hevea brasiliensis]
MELGALLDPGRPPKMDKSVILADALKMVNQLKDEAQKLKDSNESLQDKINELKVEKSELRYEKQRLKTQKENLEQQVKTFSAGAGFLPHPPAIPVPFPSPAKLLVASWYLLLAIPEFPCGGLCLLQPLIPRRILFYALQLHCHLPIQVK